MRRFSRLALAVLIAANLSGCSFGLDWIETARAHHAVAKHDYASALKSYREIVNRSPDSPRALQAAREAARVAQFDAKDYEAAVEFYRIIILRSPDSEERKSAQRYIAQIYFENLRDYDHAIVEYERLLELDHTATEAFQYRLDLAKCQFQLNNLDQAAVEIDTLLSQKLADDQIYEAKVVKANILVASKKLPEAAALWEDILKSFPARAQRENAGLNLVVCYEEMKDFGKAIDVLEKMRSNYPNPDFINLRIERLKLMEANQPGAHGLKP